MHPLAKLGIAGAIGAGLVVGVGTGFTDIATQGIVRLARRVFGRKGSQGELERARLLPEGGVLF